MLAPQLDHLITLATFVMIIGYQFTETTQRTLSSLQKKKEHFFFDIGYMTTC
jgi:hypothetical protein